MTDLPFSTPEPDPARPERAPRRHVHRWGPGTYGMVDIPVIDGVATLPDGRTVATPAAFLRVPVLGPDRCVRCGKERNPAASRRSKNNRSRGLAIQREVAAMLDMEHIPGNGPADARDAAFVAEIKSGPSWYSTRVEAELDNLPTAGNRTPIFVAASTPGPGHGRRRVYVEVTLGDLVKMVGPHVQVAMWAPEWVALKREGEPE